jgi:hypothetical protein
MKTTVNISDSLLDEARKVASQERTTWTADRDFGRFSGMRVSNPLIIE